MPKRVIELSVTRADGTKFRCYYDHKDSAYVVEYRNDTDGVKSAHDGIVKGKWVWLDTQPMYSDALDMLWDFAKEHDATQPPH